MEIELPPRRHWLLKLFVWLSFIGCLLSGSLIWYWIHTAPPLTQKAILQNQAASEYLDAHGQVFYSLDNMPPIKTTPGQFKKANNLRKALLSIEDRDFYRESGTNPKRIAVAAVHDAGRLIGRGTGSVQGASTLTQQLIKVSYFSTKAKDRTIKRKVQEIYLAEQLNRRLSKNQILYAYFNKVYLGNGIHGMATASHYYFNKTVDQLTVPEAAMLAGMVQSPTAYDPYRRANLTQQRRDTVLKAMYANHKLTYVQLKQALHTPMVDPMPTFRTQIDHLRATKRQKLDNDYYVSAVNNQLQSVLGHDGSDLVMRVQTPFEPAVQKLVNDAVNQQSYPSAHLQTAVIIINNQTGQVVALNGGRLNSQQVIGGYNRAITASRSSGSAIKPVLDYAPYFDLFTANPNTKIDDTPYRYPGSGVAVHDWDNHYQGSITMRQALVGSRNIPAVRNFVAMGLDRQTKLLQALGIPTKNIFAPIAIGTNVSPLTLTDAYTALANNGMRTAPQFVTGVKYRGQQLGLTPQKVSMYSPAAAAMTTDILTGIFSAEGTAGAANINGLTAAGKTGAADAGSSMPHDALSDAWYIGYTPQYTVGVWTGYDNPYNPHEYLKTNDEVISQQIYKRIMEPLSQQPGFNRQLKFVGDSGTTQTAAPFLDAQSQLASQKPDLQPSVSLKAFFR